MRDIKGQRILPNAAEVEDILRRLCYPKTVSQLSS